MLQNSFVVNKYPLANQPLFTHCFCTLHTLQLLQPILKSSVFPSCKKLLSSQSDFQTGSMHQHGHFLLLFPFVLLSFGTVGKCSVSWEVMSQDILTNLTWLSTSISHIQVSHAQGAIQQEAFSPADTMFLTITSSLHLPCKWNPLSSQLPRSTLRQPQGPLCPILNPIYHVTSTSQTHLQVEQPTFLSSDTTGFQTNILLQVGAWSNFLPPLPTGQLRVSLFKSR